MVSKQGLYTFHWLKNAKYQSLSDEIQMIKQGLYTPSSQKILHWNGYLDCVWLAPSQWNSPKARAWLGYLFFWDFYCVFLPKERLSNWMDRWIGFTCCIVWSIECCGVMCVGFLHSLFSAFVCSWLWTLACLELANTACFFSNLAFSSLQYLDKIR